MNSTQLRKSVWSRLLRGLPRSPRAKGRARLAVEPLEDRCLLAQLSFETQPLTAALGDVLNPKDGVQVKSPEGRPVTIALGNNPGAAQLGGTVTLTPDPSTRIATFRDLYLFGGEPTSNYTLLATAPADDAAASDPFAVKDGPTNLWVKDAVKTTRAGDNLGPITVQVLDSNGTLSRGEDTGKITLFVDHNASDDPDGARFLVTVGNEKVMVDSLTETVTDGQAVFRDVRLTKAGVGFTLTAEAKDNDIIKKATSNPFVITAGAANKLDFQETPHFAQVNLPINALAGLKPPFASNGVTVQVEDEFGNPVTDSTAKVSLTLKDNPAGGNLTGGDAVTATNGLAVFPNLRIDKAGDGYTLQAAADGFNPVVLSQLFSVVASLPTPRFLDSSGNPTANPIGTATVQWGGLLPTIIVEADGALGQQITLSPQGKLFGETTATVAMQALPGHPDIMKPVAIFRNVYLGGDAVGQSVTLRALFLNLPAPVANSDSFTPTAGVAVKLLFANKGVIDSGIAGKALTSNGVGVQVLVQDRYGNTATDFNGAVWVGVNRAAPNSLTTPIGEQFNARGDGYGTYVKVNAVKGVADFNNKLFINRASTDYQLAVGSPDFGLGTDTSRPFNLDVGAPAQVAFLVQPDPNGVGAYQRLTGNGDQVKVAVEDEVGNVVVTDSGRDISVKLATNPDSGHAVLAGRDTIKDQNGIAVFDLLYITDTNDNPIPGFTLQATAAGLPQSDPSNPFPLNASPGGIGRTIPQPDFTVVTQPGNVGVNQPLTFSFKVSANGQPDTIYDDKVNVLVQLLNGDGTDAAGVFIGQDKIKQPVNGIVTFSGDLKVTRPGQYQIRALLDVLPANLPDGEIISQTFTVGSTLAIDALQAGPAPAADILGGSGDPRSVVNLDLASYTENFGDISSLSAYQFKPDGTKQPLSQQFQPPSAPLVGNTPPPMVQPNVVTGFGQVPQSTKWWSSIMFQRNTTNPSSGLPQDSRGNQLYPMFPDPLATMVNSSNTFAGLGLAYLTHPFVAPAGTNLSNDPGLPDTRRPGNVQYLSSYASIGGSDQRLYQDLAIGLKGLTGPQADARVLGCSDTTVTLDWNNQLQATLGEGLPFVHFLTKNMAGNATMQLVTDNPNKTTTVTAFDENGKAITSDAELDPNGPNAVRLEIKYTVTDKEHPGAPGNISITVDNNYGLFLPKGVHWELKGGTLTATLTPGDTAKNFFSVAILPDRPATAATPADVTQFYNDSFKFYRARAYSPVTGSTTNFSYDEGSGKVTTTFALQTQPIAGSQGPGLIANRPVQTLYPNQWLALYPDSSGFATDPNTTYTYQVTRGTLKVWDGPAFATTLQYRGSLPLVPPVPEDGTSHADLWNKYLLPYLVSVSSTPTFDGSLALDKLIPYGQNNYLDFQSLLGAAQLIPILVEVSQSKDAGLTDADRALALTSARKIFTIVEAGLSAWLSVKDDGNLQMLYYQPPTLQEKNNPGGIGWQALLSEKPGFLSSESLNDQNLIYGYLLKTAAIIDLYDSQWGDTRTNVKVGNEMQTFAGKYGEIINRIIANVSNYDRNSVDFPFLRNFDVSQGHSWVDGAANDLLGTNMESSSEAINYDSALIQWGEATGDRYLRDLGIYLYTTEVASVNLYYFDNPTPFFNVKPGTVTNAFPSAFTTNPTPPPDGDNRPMITMLRSASMGISGGFVGDFASAQAGIQLVPLTGSSLYLGSNTDFVNRNYTFARSAITQPGATPVRPSAYLSVLDPYLAFLNAPFNGQTALETYLSDLPKVTPINFGVPIDTTGFNIHWFDVFQAYGQVDTSVTANTVSYAVFIKTPGDPSTRTYVAYNPDATPITVTFSDGSPPLTVPGRSMRVSRPSQGSQVTVATQTYPDFTLQTPANRFFLSSARDPTSGDYTLLSGQTGKGESSVDIPPPSRPGTQVAPHPPGPSLEATFQVTGLTGTLKGDTAQAFFSFWLDPQYPLPAKPSDPAPQTAFIRVQITYQDGPVSEGGTGKVVTHLYDGIQLSNNPGYVNGTSVNNGALTDVIPVYLPKLTDATVTVQVWARDGNNAKDPHDDPNGKPIPIRLRTDAAAQQGRVSYLDLPYDFTQIGQQSVNDLKLATTPTVPNAEVSPRSEDAPVEDPGSGTTATGHTYRASLSGTTATFIGNASSDVLTFSADTATGLLMHNRTGDPSFVNAFDFDSFQPGVQSLAAATTSQVIVYAGSGVETINLGTATSPASALLARFTIHNELGGLSNQLTINDSASRALTNFTVNGATVTTSNGSLSVQLTGQPFGGGISLITGSAGDGVNVLATRAGEPLSLNSRSGLDVITIGDGSVQNIRGDVTVRNNRSFSDLTVDNSLAPDFAGTVTISPTSIVGLAPATISYPATEIGDMEVHTGTSQGIYQVTGSFAGSYLYVANGSGNGHVILGNNGVVNDASFPGLVLLQGGAGTDVLTIDNSAGGAADITFSQPGLSGLTTAGLQFSDFKAVDVQLGGGDDVAHVNAVTAPLTVNGSGGNDTMIVGTDPSQVLFGVNLIAGAGDDLMLGGPRDDTFVLGSGNDTVLARGGDDTIVWNSGDGNARVDGGTGNSRLVVNGSAGPDTVTVGPNGAAATVQVSSGPTSTLNVANLRGIDVNTLDGADTITVTPLPSTAINIDGGPPVTRPGDELSVQVQGLANPNLALSGPRSGQWTFANASPVSFVDIETYTGQGPPLQPVTPPLPPVTPPLEPIVPVPVSPSTVGVFDPSTGTWYLKTTNQPGASDFPPFRYGAPGWTPLTGDWDGNGSRTVGVYYPTTATWYLRNSNSAGAPDIAPFRYGAPGWIPVVGDWDGNGTMTIGVVDPATLTWYLKNTNAPGAWDVSFRYGQAGDVPVVGDWTGNGVTTIGVWRPGTATWYLRNSNSPGAPDVAPFAYGQVGDVPVAGDWNGDRVTTVGAFRPGSASWLLRNSTTPGAPDIGPFAYGGANWLPVTGPYATAGLLRAGGGEQAGAPQAAPLSQAALDGVVAAALARLQAAGVAGALLGRLSAAQFQVSDLPAGDLGRAFPSANQVLIDRDAAGHGWFVGPTPLQDEEYAAAPTGGLYAPAGTAVVWDVDPVNECVHVYSATTPGRPTTYRRGEVAEAEPAVPGWRMPVDEMFV
jgi:hypothetical protein